LRAGTTPDDTGETTMNTYTITSKAGQKMGEYTGRTEREALVAMHRDAGYPSRRRSLARTLWRSPRPSATS
jgi:hypothetical protein